ncbi:MAG TPA: hypothetical protein DDX51_02600 [Clostridiales bacterium]|nr:hypothetical protein [Clostridiales bacterium]
MPRQSKPAQQPSVRQIVVGLVQSYFTHSLAKASAELSYYMLFSIFPLLLLLSSLLAVTNVSQTSLLHLLSLLPGDVQRIVSPIITRYIGNISYREFFGRLLGFIVLGTYFFSRTMSSLMYNVNRIYNIPNRRGGIGQLIFEILTAGGFVFAIVCSFVLLVLGRLINALFTQFLEIPQQLMWVMELWHHGRYIIAIGLMFLFLLLLCYLAPNCIMRFRDALPGAIFTLLMWIGGTMLFTFYINHINQYDALYGSISAIMVLMLWLYMTGIILFLGFELNLILMKKKHRNFIVKGKPWYIRFAERTLRTHRKNQRQTRKK